MKRSHCSYCAEPYPANQLDEHGACANCRRFVAPRKPVGGGSQADSIMFRGQLPSPTPERPAPVRPEPKLRNVSGNLTLDGREYEVVGQLTLLPLDD